MKKLPYFIALSAVLVSGSAAFYSVYGLSKLFAGSLSVIIMAGSLEFSKIVIASFLYSYWKKINIYLKYYLSIALFILVCITSLGIYGYLSDAYQKSYNNYLVFEKGSEIVETKKYFFSESKKEYQNEREKIILDINELRKGLSYGSTYQYKDKSGNIFTGINSQNRKSFEEQLEDALKRRDLVDQKIQSITDSIISLDLNLIELSKENNLSELGPLVYISELTGYSMHKVVNVFLILLMIVFDPLAVALVFSANIAFNNFGNILKKEDNYIGLKNKKK